jgi:hypothetical protein
LLGLHSTTHAAHAPMLCVLRLAGSMASVPKLQLLVWWVSGWKRWTGRVGCRGALRPRALRAG